MNILEKKINIIEWLLKLQDETILNKIELIHKYSVDEWDQLTDVQKAEIDNAISEIERGEGVAHDTVMDKLMHR